MGTKASSQMPSHLLRTLCSASACCLMNASLAAGVSDNMVDSGGSHGGCTARPASGMLPLLPSTWPWPSSSWLPLLRLSSSWPSLSGPEHAGRGRGGFLKDACVQCCPNQALSASPSSSQPGQHVSEWGEMGACSSSVLTRTKCHGDG